MKIEMPAPPDFSFAETLSAHGWRRLAPFEWEVACPIREMITTMAATPQLHLETLFVLGNSF